MLIPLDVIRSCSELQWLFCAGNILREAACFLGLASENKHELLQMGTVP